MKPSKLIIQIPCFNEEETLPITLAALPKSIPGVDAIELLVMNDGSHDQTVQVAKKNGVHHILDFKTKRGLAYCFEAGILEAWKLGADYVVNLDADNQYNASDIPLLLKPLQEGQADMVVGERPISSVESFSPLKKILQRWGSAFVSSLSGTPVRDTPSGFRALNRKAMIGLNIFNPYTYTHESLLSATDSKLVTLGVPIRVNQEVLRPSRLISSVLRYVSTSGFTALRFHLLYKPYKLFLFSSVCSALLSIGLFASYFFLDFGDKGAGLELLIFAVGLALISLILFSTSLIIDASRINRKLLLKFLTEFRESRVSKSESYNKN